MKYKNAISEERISSVFEYTSKEVKKLMIPGHWHDEPDFIQFDYNHTRIDTYYESGHPIVVTPGSRLTCVITRSPFQNLNGYVGVDHDSPLFGASCDMIYDFPRSHWVHGGLTYANRIIPFKSKEPRPYKYLRYVHNRQGWAKKKWFFGFDCGHAGDLSPSKSMNMFSSMLSGEYRDQEYVMGEVLNLAAWILKIETAIKQGHPEYKF